MSKSSINKTTMEQDFAQLKGKELLSKRSVAQKTFDLGKGRRQAISYGEPVHFRNSEGWQEIDNRLVLDEKNSVYRTSANAYATELACKDSGKDIVTLRRDGVAFGIRYFGEANGATAEILENEKQEYANEQEARADLSEKLHSGVKYTELRPGMDVEVRIDGKGFKDNIILKTQEALDYAGVELPEGFEYEQEKDGSIKVYREGNDYITISIPFVFDAEGKEVSVHDILTGNQLRYVLETSDDTVYPLTIDPYISYSDTTGSMETTYIDSSNPSTNYTNRYLYCGVRTAVTGTPELISLVKPTTLVAQKSSDTILSAGLYMRIAAYGSLKWFLGAYPIKTAWSETGATWNNMTPADDTHISGELMSYISNIANSNWGCFDITEAYKRWYKKENGSTTNYGVALRRACAATYNYAEFYSSRQTDGYPYVVVNYVSHAGRKGWWQYESMDAGRAGSVYADIYNGNLIAEHEDTATAGSRMPVSLSHIYNSCLSDEDAAYCGLGWRLSLSQSLRKETIVSQDYYIWQDGDGTEHYFEVSGSQP